MNTGIDPTLPIDLHDVMEVLNEHVTESLLESTFEGLREGERRRTLTLQAMVTFWTAVVLRAPSSLSEALREASEGGASLYPQIGVSDQAFFKRSSELSWEFFAGVFRAFAKRCAASEPPRYAKRHEEVAKRFASITVVDGSNLDPVARRLKILQGKAGKPVPGCVLACYDLMGGVLTDLLFAPTLRKGELTLAREAFAKLAPGTLVVADRLYGTPMFLEEVTGMGLYGIFRRQGSNAQIEEIACLSRTTHGGAQIEDWEIKLGKKARHPARLIRVTRGEKTYEYVTNVLDPERLSAHEVVDLYEDRWTVERLFFDLKEVLNLHRFYCGNTNAIAMQVYAAAIVHTAMRVCQGRIAEDASVEPEALSPAKLFPRLAAIAAILSVLELGFSMTEDANPGVALSKPDWRTLCRLSTTLGQILADKTREKRKRGSKPKKKAREPWQEMPPPPKRPGTPGRNR